MSCEIIHGLPLTFIIYYNAGGVIITETGVEEPLIQMVSHSYCPECNTPHGDFEYDRLRDEIVCRGCGLVLSGPPSYVAGHTKVSYPFEHRFCVVVGDFYQYYGSYSSLYLSGRSLTDRQHLDYDPIR